MKTVSCLQQTTNRLAEGAEKFLAELIVLFARRKARLAEGEEKKLKEEIGLLLSQFMQRYSEENECYSLREYVEEKPEQAAEREKAKVLPDKEGNRKTSASWLRVTFYVREKREDKEKKSEEPGLQALFAEAKEAGFIFLGPREELEMELAVRRGDRPAGEWGKLQMVVYKAEPDAPSFGLLSSL